MCDCHAERGRGRQFADGSEEQIPPRFALRKDNQKGAGMTTGKARQNLTEGRQMDQIIVRHRLQGFPSFAPCGNATYDHKRVEASLSQHVRHPGARGLALSSTVNVDVLASRQELDLFIQIVWFNSH